MNDVPFEQLDFRSASLAPTTLEAIESGSVRINGQELNSLQKQWILLDDLKDKLQSVQVTQVDFVGLGCSS